METYEIRQGDTLGKIAKKFYGDAGKYILIAEANDILNPDRIEVGQVLKIPREVEDLGETTDMMTIDSPELPIDKTTLRLSDGQYMKESKPKNLIVLHFTAGRNARGAYNTWEGDSHRIATAYIVDTDGVIYEAFAPNFWAYALGIKGQPDKRNEKRAIQIEIANVGPLVRRDDVLYWWPPVENGVETYKTRWCHISEGHKYVEASFRGRDYYASFPHEQFLAVGNLVKHLCETFEIEKTIPFDRLEDVDLAWFSEFRGIASHQNFRRDKYDIGPAFDWEQFAAIVG